MCDGISASEFPEHCGSIQLTRQKTRALTCKSGNSPKARSEENKSSTRHKAVWTLIRLFPGEQGTPPTMSDTTSVSGHSQCSTATLSCMKAQNYTYPEKWGNKHTCATVSWEEIDSSELIMRRQPLIALWDEGTLSDWAALERTKCAFKKDWRTLRRPERRSGAVEASRNRKLNTFYSKK